MCARLWARTDGEADGELGSGRGGEGGGGGGEGDARGGAGLCVHAVMAAERRERSVCVRTEADCSRVRTAASPRCGADARPRARRGGREMHTRTHARARAHPRREGSARTPCAALPLSLALSRSRAPSLRSLPRPSHAHPTPPHPTTHAHTHTRASASAPLARHRHRVQAWPAFFEQLCVDDVARKSEQPHGAARALEDGVVILRSAALHGQHVQAAALRRKRKRGGDRTCKRARVFCVLCVFAGGARLQVGDGGGEGFLRDEHRGRRGGRHGARAHGAEGGARRAARVAG
jgi:hypothetical protein